MEILCTTLKLAPRSLDSAEVRMEVGDTMSQGMPPRFQELVESINGIVWEAEALTFDFTFVSGKATEILGYSVEQWLADPNFWISHMHPDDREATLAYCRAATNDLRPHQMEYRMIGADGQVVWLHDVVSVISEMGKPTRLRGVMVDVSDRVRARQALDEEESKLRTLIDVMPDFVNFKDGEGRWILANDFGRRLFHLERVDYNGLTDRELADRVPSFREGLLACEKTDEVAWRNGSLTRGHERFHGPEGELHIFDVLKLPLFHPDGGRKAIVVVGRDVTERCEAEDRLRDLNEHLEELVGERTRDLARKNRELEAFTYSVTHDLKAPLRALNEITEALVEDHKHDIPVEAVTAIERLASEASRMRKLVDDLLHLSRSSHEPLRIERVDLTTLARGILRSLQVRDAERHVEIKIADGLEARGDAALLAIVLQNLLDNAWKYTARRPDGQLEVGTIRISGRDAFFVRDNGAGFDPAKANVLFEPFRRLHGHEFEGTGIGLATVGRIIARHGGRVWGESEGPGLGATFFFTFPSLREETERL